MNNDYSYSLDKLEKLATNVFSDLSSYQDHKENMANAGFLFQFTLLSGFITQRDLITNLFKPKCTLSLLIIATWLIIHLFIRWQLRNRKKAALEQNGILLSMSEWITKKPNTNDLKPYIQNENYSFKSKAFFLVDFFPNAISRYA